MSDRPKQGEPSEFAIITKAKDLVKHTYMMTSEKRFPKKHRKIVDRLENTTIDIFDLIQDANELDLADPQECRDRLREQKQALTMCKRVLFLIELSFERGLISKEQCEAWSKCVLDVKNMTAKWRKQDRARAATMQRGNAPRR